MSAAKTRSSLGVLVFLLVVLGGVVLASTQRQWLYDQMSAWRYQPSGQISTIRAKLTLTNDGAFYFNASQPKLETASNFNQNCQQQPEANNPILGCYVANRIYVFDVTNPELNGIEETTAAHELLHAVYQRLSEDEKTILSQELDMKKGLYLSKDKVRGRNPDDSSCDRVYDGSGATLKWGKL